MNVAELEFLLSCIPEAATELAVYPTNRNTLFFSLPEGVSITQTRGYQPARDTRPEEGLSRWKIVFNEVKKLEAA